MREESNRRFPVEVGAALDLYLERVRRQWPLAYAARSGEAVHDDLWISKGGKPASPGTMAAAMKTATADSLGYAVSPHRLRDRSATYIVEEMPTQAALASAILRHRSSNTTQEYMRKAEQIRAFRGFPEPRRFGVREHGGRVGLAATFAPGVIGERPRALPRRSGKRTGS
jgi:site-specific recombinase XerD